MNEYLVTGGLGFIGSHLVESLLRDDPKCRVWIVDDSTNAVWNPRRGRLDAEENIRDLLVQLMGGYEVTSDPRNPRLVCVGGDFAHRNILELVRSARFTCVFHLAGHCSVTQSIERPLDYLEHNVAKTLELAKACAEGLTKIVFSSSAAVYGSLDSAVPISESAAMFPANPYGATKMTVENWFRVYKELYDLDYVNLRYFNAYGPRQKAGSPYAGAIANWVHSIWMNKPAILYGDGEQTRDFVHVDDIVQANIKAMKADTSCYHTFNIATEHRTSLNTILDTLSEITGRKIETKLLPSRDGDVEHSVGDNGRAKTMLHWHPETDLRTGLESLLKWRGVECKIE